MARGIRAAVAASPGRVEPSTSLRVRTGRPCQYFRTEAQAGPGPTGPPTAQGMLQQHPGRRGQRHVSSRHAATIAAGCRRRWRGQPWRNGGLAGDAVSDFQKAGRIETRALASPQIAGSEARSAGPAVRPQADRGARRRVGRGVDCGFGRPTTAELPPAKQQPEAAPAAPVTERETLAEPEVWRRPRPQPPAPKSRSIFLSRRSAETAAMAPTGPMGGLERQAQASTR